MAATRCWNSRNSERPEYQADGQHLIVGEYEWDLSDRATGRPENAVSRYLVLAWPILSSYLELTTVTPHTSRLDLSCSGDGPAIKHGSNDAVHHR